MVHGIFTHNSISSKTFSVIYRREEAMSYGQGNRYAELMGLRGASSENAPEPAAAKMWRDESIRSGHGMGYSVERLNNEWARPPLAPSPPPLPQRKRQCELMSRVHSSPC